MTNRLCDFRSSLHLPLTSLPARHRYLAAHSRNHRARCHERPHATLWSQAESEDSHHPASSFIVTCNKVSSNSDPCLPWNLSGSDPVADSPRRTSSASDAFSYLSRSSRLPPTSARPHARNPSPTTPPPTLDIPPGLVPSFPLSLSRFLIIGASCDLPAAPRTALSHRAGVYLANIFHSNHHPDSSLILSSPPS